MKYASLSTSVLRGMLAVLSRIGVRSRQRDAIERELLVRAFADWWVLNMHRLIRWSRGGLS